jgi:curved DNA-binding protein CbpA
MGGSISMADPDHPTVACPICSGPLTPDPDHKQWSCDVGHHFSLPELGAEQATAIIRTLWYALRSLQDRAISGKFGAKKYDQEGLAHEAEILRARNVEDLAMVEELHDLLDVLKGSERRPAEQSGPISHRDEGRGSHEADDHND